MATDIMVTSTTKLAHSLNSFDSLGAASKRLRGGEGLGEGCGF